MKRYFATLLVMAFVAGFTQQASARLTVNVRYGNFREYLDLQAVATTFSRSDNIEEFEYRLNDPRNPVSNLDLNNDGYVDYLRVEQYSERNEHVIYIQAVLSRNYSQTVATIYVGRDRFNDEYVQIVGDESIYGYNYIIEPVFRRRPVIVRWLWTWNSPRYVSPYYWGYYPRHYRVHHIVALPAYHNRVKRYVDHRHEYRRIEKDNRRYDRDRRDRDDRRDDNKAYRENDRRSSGGQRIEEGTRPGRQPEVRQQDRSSNSQPEVRQEERTTNRRPEVNRSSSSSSRETVRESRPAPQRQASESRSRSSERSSSERSSSNGNSRR
ncbi:MAG: hypothetical protein BGP01_01295 [Paludibacter sp. 47-17]|nr:MAG: hypothetical protein BGP01_01295 [Paludibacter sp. 47-17]